MKHSRLVLIALFTIVLILCGVAYFSYYIHLNTKKLNKIPWICGASLSHVSPVDDFQSYPCLETGSNISSTHYGARHCIRTVCKQPIERLPTVNPNCVILKPAKTEICTSVPSKDLISRILHETGEWESSLIGNLQEILKVNPDMVFMDIGCNIGVYTIVAAAMRTKTICVDANPENLRLVSESLSRGRMENYVTLVWNALSDQRSRVNFHIIEGNSGSSRLGDISKYNIKKKKDISVNAILLDDLQWLVTGNTLYIKLDAEGHELFILKGAHRFFKNIDVKVIQMELLEPDTYSEVVSLLKECGYTMFRDLLGRVRINETEFINKQGPGDVYFIKM